MSVHVPFSERPGRHERHYKRKLDNPLFPRPEAFDKAMLLEVQRLDHEELVAFLTSLRQLVYRATQLSPNEETQVILDLKGELEKHYELACGLADAQEANKQAIAHLIEAIMNTLRRNAAGDRLAEQELADETLARQWHFELLETPLVADLLHPQTLIQADELVPVLLSEDEHAVRQALHLFDTTQRQHLHQEATRLLAQNDLANSSDYESRLAWFLDDES